MHHKVHKAPQCMFPRWNWDPLTPSSASEHAPPPETKGGHTIACGWGGGGVPIPTTGEKAWHSVYSVVCTNKRAQDVLIFAAPGLGRRRFRNLGGVPFHLSQVSATLQRKFHLCISFLGIARPQSQFPHLCAYERFIYSQDRSTYFPQTHECGSSDCGRAVPFLGIFVGFFAVHSDLLQNRSKIHCPRFCNHTPPPPSPEIYLIHTVVEKCATMC